MTPPASGGYTSISCATPRHGLSYTNSEHGGATVCVGDGAAKASRCFRALVDVSAALASILSHCFCRHRHITPLPHQAKYRGEQRRIGASQLGRPANACCNPNSGPSHRTRRAHVGVPASSQHRKPTRKSNEPSQPHHCTKCRQPPPLASSPIRHTDPQQR